MRRRNLILWAAVMALLVWIGCGIDPARSETVTLTMPKWSADPSTCDSLVGVPAGTKKLYVWYMTLNPTSPHRNQWMRYIVFELEAAGTMDGARLILPMAWWVADGDSFGVQVAAADSAGNFSCRPNATAWGRR